MAEIPRELQYVLLLFGLLVLPKMLQRFRVPSAITQLLLGIAFGAGLGIFQHDETVHLLSTFGIAALFLFAGLDVDLDGLRSGARILVEHLVIVALTLAVAAVLVTQAAPIGWRASVLVALAIVTPSTGFILESLSSLGVSAEESYWIRTKAIASELLALGVLFVTLQSTSAARLGLSAVAMLAMAAFLPVLLRFLADGVSRHAPNSEFAFLLIVAVIFAYATRQLGVYYLVGAFLVGITARRLREQLPRLLQRRPRDQPGRAVGIGVAAGSGVGRDLHSPAGCARHRAEAAAAVGAVAPGQPGGRAAHPDPGVHAGARRNPA